MHHHNNPYKLIQCNSNNIVILHQWRENLVLSFNKTNSRFGTHLIMNKIIKEIFIKNRNFNKNQSKYKDSLSHNLIPIILKILLAIQVIL
jgi:hypothetical protein